jgi:hypothetical protein
MPKRTRLISHGAIRRRVSLVRHSHVCKICAHKKREEIEAEFVAWESPATIAKNYHLADRAIVYRHAHAFGLFEKRRWNVCAALERIIEHAGEVDVTAQAVATAVQAYGENQRAGQWIDRTEQVNLNELFERMTQEELEMYARDGQLPVWFTQTVVATPKDNQEVKNDT